MDCLRTSIQTLRRPHVWMTSVGLAHGLAAFQEKLIFMFIHRRSVNRLKSMVGMQIQIRWDLDLLGLIRILQRVLTVLSDPQANWNPSYSKSAESKIPAFTSMDALLNGP
jgi:hypothetical protein